MDPNRLLADIRLTVHVANTATGSKANTAARDVVTMFELMDEWLSNGGFLPAEWDVNRTGD